MRIAFFIGSLDTGGAERQVVLLAEGLAARGHSVWLITVFPGGYSRTLADVPNLTLLSLNPTRGRSLARRVIQLAASPLRLRCLLKRERPDRLYSMLHLSNLFAWLATSGALRPKLVWGYRASNMRLNWKRLIPDRLCAWVSPTVPLMIANSRTGLRCAQQYGYRPKRGVVIPNGIDTEVFQPQPGLAAHFRAEIGVDTSTPLVGIIARMDPMKGHDIFLQSAAQIVDIFSRCRFVCIGDGHSEYKQKILQQARHLGLSEKVFWFDNRTDMPAIYSALDVVVSSSSYGEGFSNVVGEAMACGTPCVVTDVGDSSYIVGQTGKIVKPGNVEEMAKAIICILQDKKCLLSGCLRERIFEKFSIERLLYKTEQTI